MNIKTAVWLCAAVILCINVDVAFTNCNYYCEEAQRFKIVSWNLEVFGATKWNENNGANRPHLINTVLYSDIFLAQEIRDQDEDIVDLWFAAINNASTVGPYGKIISAPLGSSSTKNAYGFFFRTHRLISNGTLQYDDPDNEEFERPPFCVRFGKNGTVVPNFVICNIHNKPGTSITYLEMASLRSVIDAVKSTWSDIRSDIVLMGDMNADCNTMSQAKRRATPLRHGNMYDGYIMYWLIQTGADTTASSTHCAYDRIIVSGDDIPCAVSYVPPPGIYNITEEYGLTEQETDDLSDHYPIWFDLCWAWDWD